MFTQTVSRVINNRPDVSPDTRRRVQQIIARYGARNGWLDGKPAITVRPHDAGRVDLIGAYLDDASQGALLNRIAQEAGVSRTRRTPEGIEACRRVNDRGEEILIGPMGLVHVHPEAEWMQRTRTVRAIKTALRTDHWVERQNSEIDRLLDQIVAHVHTVAGDRPLDWTRVREKLSGAVCETAISQLLLPTFAEQFAGMREDKIERMMQSFAFRDCVVRDELVRVIASRSYKR